MCNRTIRIMMATLIVSMFVAAMALVGRPVMGAPRADVPVVFEAHDYGFTGPDRIPAGVTTVQVVNKGQDVHHIQLVRLSAGKTAAEFAAALKADGRLPAWIQMMGGPNVVVPGSQTLATMNLPEGEYVLICLIPDQKGVPHMALGMQKAVSVKGGTVVKTAEPKAGAALTLSDFRIVPSRPIKPGLQTIEVLNHGTQPHEVVVVQLVNPEISVGEFIKAWETTGALPPSGRPIGGVVGIDKGGHAFFTAQFEPGRYGMMCFFPDVATGQPHFARGMAMELTVQ